MISSFLFAKLFRLDSELGMNILEAFNELDSLLKYNNEFTIKETKNKVITTTTTKTLIADDTFINNLVAWTKDKWKFGRSDLTTDMVKQLLPRMHQIVDLRRIDPESDSGYEQEWNDGSRWEGDYNPDDRHYQLVKHSFADVVSEFIDENPDKVKFDVDTKTEEKDYDGEIHIKQF